MKYNTLIATSFALLLAALTSSAVSAYSPIAYEMGNKSKTDNMVGYTQEMRFAPYYWNYTTSDDSRTYETPSYRRMIPVVAGGQTITNVEVGSEFNGQYIYTSWRYYQERTGMVNYPSNAIWVNTQNGYGFYLPATGSQANTTVIYIVSNQAQSTGPNGQIVINLNGSTPVSTYPDYSKWYNHIDYSKTYNNTNYTCKDVVVRDQWVETRPNIWTRVPGKTTRECGYTNGTTVINNGSSSHHGYSYHNGYYGYVTPAIEKPSAAQVEVSYNRNNTSARLTFSNPGSIKADEYRIIENGIQIAAARLSNDTQSGEYIISDVRYGSEYKVELCKNNFCTTSKEVVTYGRY